MAKGNKDSKPWSFGFFEGKKGTKSMMAFVVVLVISIFTHIGGAVFEEIQDRRRHPVLALKSFLRDVREYVRLKKEMPADMRQLELHIWYKGDEKKPSLLHGRNIRVKDNYEYVFHGGKSDNRNLICLWAIPLGVYRDNYETVLLLISDDGDQSWRGPALTDEQRQIVLQGKFGYNPTYTVLSQLNMKKDAPAGKK